MALRRQDNARIVFEKKRLRAAGTVTLAIGARHTWLLGDMSVDDFDALQRGQQGYPAFIATIDGRNYWQFRNRIYWESDGLDASAVHALLVTRQQREAQRVQRAQEIVATGSQPRRVVRGAIPEDVKHLVWTRDRGRCRLCGATAELQFDHVIPVSMGGSSTAENLQVLCGGCNRRKSASVSLTESSGYYNW